MRTPSNGLCWPSLWWSLVGSSICMWQSKKCALPPKPEDISGNIRISMEFYASNIIGILWNISCIHMPFTRHSVESLRPKFSTSHGVANSRVIMTLAMLARITAKNSFKPGNWILGLKKSGNKYGKDWKKYFFGINIWS